MIKQKIQDKSLLILLVVIVSYSVLCLSTTQSGILTADAMLYVSLAEKYLSGDIQNAVNGYWGPLLAWLFVPFLAAGI
jgi:hypothetical protein